MGNIKCTKCGSTSYVENHHISYNPEITTPVCIFCHANQHPNKRNLILSRLKSFRWNISMATLARRAGTTPYAILVKSYKLGIKPGVLTEEQERILSEPYIGISYKPNGNILTKQVHELPVLDSSQDVKFTADIMRLKKLIQPPPVFVFADGYILCPKCDHTWKPKTNNLNPKNCPKCSLPIKHSEQRNDYKLEESPYVFIIVDGLVLCPKCTHVWKYRKTPKICPKCKLQVERYEYRNDFKLTEVS